MNIKEFFVLIFPRRRFLLAVVFFRLRGGKSLKLLKMKILWKQREILWENIREEKLI